MAEIDGVCDERFEALREVLAGTTALVVAHRPSTVQLADRVALLSGGRIADVGTHSELLQRSAEYRHLMTGEPLCGTSPQAGAETGTGGTTGREVPVR